MNEEKIYNHLLNIAFINLYTLSKDNKKVILTNFSFNNKQHLLLLNIAKNLHNIYGYEIFVDDNFYNFIKYKIKHRKDTFIHRNKKLISCINVDEFLNHITTAQNIDKNIWIKIYNDFFGDK